MREKNVSGSERFIAPAMKIGRTSVKILNAKGTQISVAIPDGIPAGLKLPEAGTILKNVSVSLNGGLDTLYGYYPAKGDHIARFDSFTHKKDALPMPNHVDSQPPTPSRPWEIKEHYIFTALVRIDDENDPFNGCLIPWTFDYLFDRDVDNTAMLKGTLKQRAKVRDFLGVCGFDTINEILPYSENVLPELEQILSERSDDHPFKITMQRSDNGKCWIDSAEELGAGLSTLGAEDPFEDDLEDEEVADLVPPKKSRGEAVRELESDLVGELYGKKRADPDGEFEDDEDEEEEPPAPKAKRKAF